MLMAAGVTLDGTRQKVAEAVSAEGNSNAIDLPLTDRAKRALERASRLSLRRHEDHVETEHVLVSLLDVEGTAGQVLGGLAVDPARVRAALESPSDDERTGDGDRASPRCAVCRSALEKALAHTVVTSHGEGGHRQDFVAAFCSSCGSAIGSSAV
jgi:ATP-dependent Clp protease ATP-binding subunit ClpA